MVTSARALVAGAVLVIGMVLGSGGLILASYALWELVSIVAELTSFNRDSAVASVESDPHGS